MQYLPLALLCPAILAAPANVARQDTTSDELLQALGPLGQFANQVNDCIPADVAVSALEPANSLASINLDIDQSDIRVQDILSCISDAVPASVSSHMNNKRSPGITVNIGGI